MMQLNHNEKKIRQRLSEAAFEHSGGLNRLKTFQFCNHAQLTWRKNRTQDLLISVTYFNVRSRAMNELALEN